MLVVTGGIACGKSTFVEVARSLGYSVIDADEWFHQDFRLCDDFQSMTKMLFGDTAVKDAAFVHPNWATFENFVSQSFCDFVNVEKPVICVIPEFFKRASFFRSNIDVSQVLTIERQDNLNAAIHRDGHRSAEATQKILDNQTTSVDRQLLADNVLFNGGLKAEFQQRSAEWLVDRPVKPLTN